MHSKYFADKVTEITKTLYAICFKVERVQASRVSHRKGHPPVLPARVSDHAGHEIRCHQTPWPTGQGTNRLRSTFHTFQRDNGIYSHFSSLNPPDYSSNDPLSILRLQAFCDMKWHPLTFMVVTFNKLLHVLWPKPDRCPWLLGAVPRTFPPDTRQLSTLCHEIHGSPADLEHPLNVLGCEKVRHFFNYFPKSVRSYSLLS